MERLRQDVNHHYAAVTRSKTRLPLLIYWHHQSTLTLDGLALPGNDFGI